MDTQVFDNLPGLCVLSQGIRIIAIPYHDGSLPLLETL